jgi:hypothetical protein
MSDGGVYEHDGRKLHGSGREVASPLDKTLKWTPGNAVLRAVVALPDEYTAQELAEALDLELGYTEMYEALGALVASIDGAILPLPDSIREALQQARATLAKARGLRRG